MCELEVLALLASQRFEQNAVQVWLIMGSCFEPGGRNQKETMCG